MKFFICIYILCRLLFCRISTNFTTYWYKYTFLSYLIFFKYMNFYQLFCTKIIFHWKKGNFGFFETNCRNINFPCGQYFLNACFFLYEYAINLLKISKLGTNCRNKLSSWLTFYKCVTFSSLNAPSIRLKSAKFLTNCQNLNLSHGWYFLNVRFSCINMLFCKTSEK